MILGRATRTTKAKVGQGDLTDRATPGNSNTKKDITSQRGKDGRGQDGRSNRTCSRKDVASQRGKDGRGQDGRSNRTCSSRDITSQRGKDGRGQGCRSNRTCSRIGERAGTLQQHIRTVSI